MRQGSKDQQTAEALRVAKAIIAIPAGDVASAIRKMIVQRNFSRTVVALDSVVSEYPEHRQVCVTALDKLGLWWESDHGYRVGNCKDRRPSS